MEFKITVRDIEFSLCNLDTEYREALAHCLMNRDYLSDSPLNLSYGTEKQRQELERVLDTPLRAQQIKEIIDYISNEMEGDFQFDSYKRIANNYMKIANVMEKEKIKKPIDMER